MKYSSAGPARVTVTQPEELPGLSSNGAPADKSEKSVRTVRLFWENRRFLMRIALYAVLVSAGLAFLISARYQSTAHLMPPDNQGSSGLAMAAAAMANSASGSPLGGMATDLLGMKSNSDIFVGILSSRTAQDKLINDFNLQKVYGIKRMEDARRALADYFDEHGLPYERFETFDDVAAALS